jgi:iron-sulfur cluster repair protein YtfE (RIC family)
MAHECSCHHDSPMASDTPASPVRAEQTVADVAGHRAGALEIMKELGINHCCGAHLTLREAAAAAGVPLDALLAALNEPRKTPA